MRKPRDIAASAWSRAFSAIVGGVLLSGCYTYTASDSPALGSTVRVYVPVVSALTGNGGERTESIEGQLLEGGDTLSLAVTTRRELGAYREIIQYDTLRLAADQTSLVEVRELSTGRSVVLGGLIMAGAATAAIFTFTGGGGTDPGPPDPGPVVSLVVSRSLVSSLLGLVVR